MFSSRKIILWNSFLVTEVFLFHFLKVLRSDKTTGDGHMFQVWPILLINQHECVSFAASSTSNFDGFSPRRFILQRDIAINLFAWSKKLGSTAVGIFLFYSYECLLLIMYIFICSSIIFCFCKPHFLLSSDVSYNILFSFCTKFHPLPMKNPH